MKLFWVDTEELMVTPARELRRMVRRDVLADRTPKQPSPQALYMRAYRRRREAERATDAD